jgi:hypothetical protein
MAETMGNEMERRPKNIEARIVMNSLMIFRVRNISGGESLSVGTPLRL